MRYVLGLDLGTNSVGWAMVRQDGGTFDNGTPILAGVRVFPEGVADMNQKKEKPRGQDRREKRGQRRVHYRRAGRRRRLRRILQSAGLLPNDKRSLHALARLDPYGLRARALEKALMPHEVGRALYHLCQRRGFKSNRKAESGDENKVTKQANALEAEIEAAGCDTLGQYCWKVQSRKPRPPGFRVRGRYTLRKMYETEFDRLWEKQRPFHPALMTDDLRERVRDAIFFQRPLRFDPEIIGDCELEAGEKRCPLAHWLSQQFRMLQEINNLRVLDGGADRPLNQDERSLLAETLAARKDMKFEDIRKGLGFLDNQTFNLESEGRRKGLKGNAVEAALRHTTLKNWYEPLSAETREAVHNALAEVEDAGDLRRLALDQWACSQHQADHLARISLPNGYGRLSAKAIRKILPFLQPAHVCDSRCGSLFPHKEASAGHVVSEAKALAGYPAEPPMPVFDRLPAIPTRGDKASWNTADPPLRQLGAALTNPLVRRTLAETRKVVNAILGEFGKPEEVVVELARDMKHSRDQRRSIHFDNIRHNEENEAIRARLASEFGIPEPSREDVLKYRLWQECDICVYTGRPIPKAKLFTPEVQIEHIYPLSRSLDDSYLNKTLCFGPEVNIRKGNKTPWEAYGATPELEAILRRAERLPWKKRRRFTVKEVAFDDFAQRQLNDTRYASRLARRYLQILGMSVRPVKGQTTSRLAHYWGLYGVLGTNYAKERDDHRYHAIDAIAIALTTRSHLQRLSTVVGASPKDRPMAPPWEDFWRDVRSAVQAIQVSYRPARKLAGALHEETGLGPTRTAHTYAYRVPVQRLTAAMAKKVRDPKVREIVLAWLAEREARKPRAQEPKISEPFPHMASGVPIKRVRIETIEKTALAIRKVAGKAVKYVAPGGNHHVEIYQKPNGAWDGRCVSRFEADNRRRRGLPVVVREPKVDDVFNGCRFIMSLCMNDMALLTMPNMGEVQLHRVQAISVSSPVVVFRLHTASTLEDKAARVLIGPWDTLRKYKVQKVYVDPLGRVHPCRHD
jgi:CRISPR-associated endonuclease Csn1